MKNISRRVFIKGMAVAAAATAASTVLAGCNIVPGKDEPVVVPGFKSETKTLTVGEEKISITTTAFGYTADGTLQLKLTAVNDGKNDINFSDSASYKDGYIYTTAYADGEYNKPCTVKYSSDPNSWEISANADGVSNVTKTFINITNVAEKWETITVVFLLTVGSKTQEVTFVLNK